jgi:hypothetical protein
MNKPTINSMIKRFTVAWHTSVEARYKAASIYADASNTWDTAARKAFWELEEFKNWTPTQWRLLYKIGSGAVAKCFLDYSRPTIPLALERRGVTVKDQERMFAEGISVADITGKVKIVKLRYVQEKHIYQVWDEYGRRRSVLQQLKYLQDNQKSNFDILPDGTIHVHHHCYITPTTFVKLLRSSKALRDIVRKAL